MVHTQIQNRPQGYPPKAFYISELMDKSSATAPFSSAKVVKKSHSRKHFGNFFCLFLKN